MADGREYELKFEVRTCDFERLIAHPDLGQPARAKRHSSTYYDTPDDHLRRRRVSLRVRRSGGESVQTLKHRGGSIVDREEWEHGGGEHPDADWLRTTPLRSLFEKKRVRGSLEPRFHVDVERRLFALQHRGAVIEGALDEGTIVANGERVPVHELELELKTGEPAAVVALARRLVTDLPLVLSLTGKAERGFAALDGTWQRPIKAIEARLDRRMSVAQAFEAIVQACLHALTKNAALIGGAHPIEATHATRIALRHLRAVLRLFRPRLRATAAKTIGRELKWMSDRLGAARDADVFQAELTGAGMKSLAPGAAELAEVMLGQQRRARARLLEALDTPRWRRLLVDLLAFASTGVRRPHRDDACRAFVRERLGKRRRALARQSRGLKRLAPHALHDVRKAAKMLRYGLEITSMKGLGASEAALARDLRILQQALGDMHDRHALREHLRATFFERGPPPGLRQDTCARASFAAGALATPGGDDRADLRRARAAAKRLRHG